MGKVETKILPKNKLMHYTMNFVLGKDKKEYTSMEMLRYYSGVQIFVICGICLLLMMVKIIYLVGFVPEAFVMLFITLGNCIAVPVYRYTKSFGLFLLCGVTGCFAVTSYVHVAFGGFYGSSGEIIWGVSAVMAVFIAFGEKKAQLTFWSYIAICIFMFLGEFYFFPSAFVSKDYLKQVDFGEINAIGIVTLVYTTLKVFFLALEKEFNTSQLLVVELEESNATTNNAMVELKNAQSQLVQSEKMASLGQLVAGIAHEINTPIGAIKASSQFIRSSISERFPNIVQNISELDANEIVLLENVIAFSIEPKEEISLLKKRKVKKDIASLLDPFHPQESYNIASLLVEMDFYSEKELAFLASIKSNLNLQKLVDTAYLFSALFRSADNINLATEKVSKIIFALKNFSHYDAIGELVEADIEKSIDTVLTLYHNQLKSGVTIIREFNMMPKTIACYPDELGQVWINLIQNAIYAMENQGTLTIATKNDESFVYVSFVDTGCGISPENMQKLFVPFYTSKPAGEGTGLGLDISKRIVEKHGGSIHVESTLSVGTTFTVTLPYKKKVYTNPD